MKIIYKAPGRSAEVRDVPNTLEALQGLVGGYIVCAGSSYGRAAD